MVGTAPLPGEHRSRSARSADDPRVGRSRESLIRWLEIGTKAATQSDPGCKRRSGTVRKVALFRERSNVSDDRDSISVKSAVGGRGLNVSCTPTTEVLYPSTMRRSVRFRGRVQGVGFRATTRSVASTLPVSGWVRNEPDGSVLMEVQGEASAIEELLRRVRERLEPVIDAVDELPMPELAGETGFVIRR